MLLAYWLAVVVFIVSIIMLLYALIAKIAGHTSVGWTSLMGSIWLIGGLIMLSLGIVGAGQFAGHVAFDIGRVMGQGEDIHRAQLGAQQPGILGQPGLDQVVTQQTELVHRKSVIRRELWAVVIVVNQRYRHRDFRVVTSAGY